MESLSKKSYLFHFKWLDHVKGTLDQAGFSDIWKVTNTDTLWLKSTFLKEAMLFSSKSGRLKLTKTANVLSIKH